MTRQLPRPGAPFVRILSRDWPRFSWTEAACVLADGRCEVHGRRKTVAGSGACSVGRGKQALDQALDLADSGGPRELAGVAAACRTELEIACFAEICAARQDRMPAAASRALSSAARRAVLAEEVISRVGSLQELATVQAWCPYILDDKGRARPELAELAILREVTLWGEISTLDRLADWVDRHFLVYLDFADPDHASGGRLFQDAIMLSRDQGFDRGASPELVAEVEQRAEQLVAWREKNPGRGIPAGSLRWLDRSEAPPNGRHARPSDDLSDLIQTDLDAFQGGDAHGKEAMSST